MSHDELRHEIAALLSDVLMTEVDSSAMNARLVDNYGSNSMDTVDIVERLETRYRIAISNAEIESLATFGDIVTAVHGKLNPS